MKVALKRLVIVAALERTVNAMLTSMNKELTMTLIDHSNDNGYIDNEKELKEQTDGIIEEFYIVYAASLVLASGKIAKERADDALREIVPRLEALGYTKEAKALSKTVSAYRATVERTVLRNPWTGDGMTLNSRIKTVKRGTQNTVRAIITQGVKDGKSTAVIAQEISQYVKPTQTKAVRQAGKIIKSRAKVMSGSVQYNVMRIARTETAQVYRQAMIDFYRDKDYVKGWGWYLSNRHPKADECNDYANTTYDSPDDYPQAHPNCLCDQRPIFYTEQELRERAKRNEQ